MPNACVVIRKDLILCILIFVFIVAGYCPALSQEKPPGNPQQILLAMDSLLKHKSVEKIYLHTDKPSYFRGDTLWFKAYIQDAAYLEATQLSSELYLELESDSNTMVRHWRFPVTGGQAQGHVVLDEDLFKEGAYTLSAFTSWTRNLGRNYVALKHLFIAPAPLDAWKVNILDQQQIAGSLKLKLELKGPQGSPPLSGPLAVRVSDGGRILFSQSLIADPEGKVDLSFRLPADFRAAKLSLHLGGLSGYEGTMTLPIFPNHNTETDLQFLPEGGYLVGGLLCRIGFKALGEDGKSVSVEGIIYNSKQMEVARFKSLHAGMGSVEFTPETGQTYYAELSQPEKLPKRYPLAAVKAAGMVLRITNPRADSVLLVRVTADSSRGNQSFLLIGQSRGIGCYGVKLRLDEAGTQDLRINKNLFPSGIARFTLFSEQGKALNERLAFIEHQDNLRINVQSHKAVFKRRDSIALEIKVQDKEGKPISGSFSVSVTDNAQVQADTACNDGIRTYLLLSSELKGQIETPGYYFNARDTAAWTALDHLMLTQGWIAYPWQELFYPVRLKYPAGAESTLKGNVLGMGFEPLEAIKLQAQSSNPLYTGSAITDSHGRFSFANIPPGAAAIHIKASRSSRIYADELKPLVFNPLRSERLSPWYLNSTQEFGPFFKIQQFPGITNRINELQAVRVRTRRDFSREGSEWLEHLDERNGNTDQVLDQQEIMNAGVTNLYDLLLSRIKGFHLDTSRYRLPVTYNKRIPQPFVLNGREVKFFWDRMYLSVVDDHSPREYAEVFQLALRSIPITQLRRVEVSYPSETVKNKDVYVQISSWQGNQNLVIGSYRLGEGRGRILFNPDANARDYIHEKIKGHKVNGTYLYRPWPLGEEKQFYSPRYTSATPSLPDIRSTLYWNQDVKTDANGTAKLSFFASDVAGSYMVRIEGTDFRGGIGSARAVLKIKN